MADVETLGLGGNLEDEGATFVGAIDLRALSAKIGISEAALTQAIFDGIPSRAEPTGPMTPPMRRGSRARTESDALLELERAQEGVPAAALEEARTQAITQLESSGYPVRDVLPDALVPTRTRRRRSSAGSESAVSVVDPAPEVALITAARRAGEPQPELQRVNGRTVLVHSLLGLEQSGIRVAIVLVAAGRDVVIAAVEEEYQPVATAGAPPMKRMDIEFVDLGEDWFGNHASSILDARVALAHHCGGAHFPMPFLLLCADRVFDPKMLQFLMHLWGRASGEEPNVLVMEDPTKLRVAPGVRAATAVRVLTAQERRHDRFFPVQRVGRHLSVYNGIEIGVFRLDGSAFFGELERLHHLRREQTEIAAPIVTAPLALAEVLDQLAGNAQLRAVPVGSYKYGSFETPQEVEISKAEFSELFFPAPKAGAVKETVNYTIEDRTDHEDDVPQPRVAILPMFDGTSEGSVGHLEDYERAAILGDAVDPYLRRLADQEDLALLVRRDTEVGSHMPENALLMPARMEGAHDRDFEDHEGEDASAMCTTGISGPMELLRAQMGLGLPSGVTGLTINLKEREEGDGGEPGDPGTVVVKIQEEVPAIGWIMLTVATLTASSSVLVIKGTGAGVPEPNIQAWRYLASTMAATPIALWNTFYENRGKTAKDRAAAGETTEATPLLGPDFQRAVSASSSNAVGAAAHREPEKQRPVDREAKIAVVMCVIAYWVCNVAFMMAISVTQHPELVALFSNLAPMVIVLSRCTGLAPGGFPTVAEMGGCAIGLAGAAICTLSRGGSDEAAPSEEVEPSKYGDLFAILGSLVASAFHAVYTVFTKIARREVSAPTLHIFMQAGSAIMSIIVLICLGQLHLSMDPHIGLFGFLYPTVGRLAAYVWMGIGVDTLGTLGYTAAMKYVSPLMTVMAALLQGSVCVFEAAAIGIEEPPNWQYLGGTLLLFGGGLTVAMQQGSEGNEHSLELKPEVGGIYELQPEPQSSGSKDYSSMRGSRAGSIHSGYGM